MIRTVLALCLALVSVSAPAHAQQAAQPRTVAGQWRVDFVTPLGQNWIIMTINQSGARLSGHATDEFGEYEINGRVAGDEVTVTWSVAEDGKMLEITMKGKLESATLITGVARLGDVGEGPLSARRTGDAGDR
jgi:Zn-dependent alcohol dehydrogenase